LSKSIPLGKIFQFLTAAYPNFSLKNFWLKKEEIFIRDFFLRSTLQENILCERWSIICWIKLNWSVRLFTNCSICFRKCILLLEYQIGKRKRLYWDILLQIKKIYDFYLLQSWAMFRKKVCSEGTPNPELAFLSLTKHWSNMDM